MMTTASLYAEDDELSKDKSPLSAEEEAHLAKITSINDMRAHSGWKALSEFLNAQRMILLNELTVESEPIAIARLQGSVQALNLFFGTTESLLSEGAFLRQQAGRNRE